MNVLRVRSDRLIVVVGPSGAGKDSVIAGWLASLPEPLRPHRVRRSITRAADPHEDHEVLSRGAFDAALAEGAFAWHWHAHGLRYGIRHRELAPLRHGGWVIVNGSRAHLPALRADAPSLRVVEVTAPRDVRADRLTARGREGAADREARLHQDFENVEPDLRLVNAGALGDAIEQLDRWWRLTCHQEAPA